MSEVLEFCLGFEICDEDFRVSKRLRNIKTFRAILAGPVNLRKKIRIFYFLFPFPPLHWRRKKEDEVKRFFFFLSFLWGSQRTHLQGNWKVHFKQFATATLCLPPFPSSQESGNASTKNALVKLSKVRRGPVVRNKQFRMLFEGSVESSAAFAGQRRHLECLH